MTRIIAGVGRGLQLQIPKSGTRPTSDKVREAIFSKLDANSAIAGTQVLDLFAGSGALGLEAASRGAVLVDLVEKAPPALNVLKVNRQTCAKLGVPINLHRGTAENFVEQLNLQPRGVVKPWELVFLDPPYDYATERLMQLINQLHPYLDPDAWVVVERSTRSDGLDLDPELWEEDSQKRYGETVVYYLRPALNKE